jgi:hypothetical protein
MNQNPYKMETLKNNSESMKTVVETFLIEETVDLIYDNEKLQKWNDLVAQLDLKGQSQIVKPEKSPIPFMHMKKGIVEVFKTLCPVKINVREFNLTPIPLEILDLISLSEREQYFGEVQIWFDDAKPDPVCIGVLQNWILHKPGSYNQIQGQPEFTSKSNAQNHITVNSIEADIYHASWKDVFYLIGRWADVKQSLEDLKAMAVKRFTEEEGNKLRKQIKEDQRHLDDLEIAAFDKFN